MGLKKHKCREATQKKARIGAKSGKKRRKGRHVSKEQRQRQARIRGPKVDKNRRISRQEKAQRQPKGGAKAGKKRSKGRHEREKAPHTRKRPKAGK